VALWLTKGPVAEKGQTLVAGRQKLRQQGGGGMARTAMCGP
jgi:hypothetical protein